MQRFVVENGNVFLVSAAIWSAFFDYDDFPSDFIFETKTKYSDSHLVQIKVIQPDGMLELLSTSSAIFRKSETIHDQRYFSTDNMMKKNLNLQLERFSI